MNQQIKELHRWHGTRTGAIFFGLGELLIAYFFLSLAIDTAGLWYYAISFVFIFGGLSNLFKAVGLLSAKGGKKPKK